MTATTTRFPVVTLRIAVLLAVPLMRAILMTPVLMMLLYALLPPLLPLHALVVRHRPLLWEASLPGSRT